MVADLGLDLSRQRALRFFSAADKENKGELDMEGFAAAYDALKRELSMQAMRDVGLGTSAILVAMAGLVATLGVVMTFLLVGISAFSGGSAFEGIVNSLMPLSAGFVQSGRSRVDPRQKLEQAARAVEEVLERLKAL